MSGSTIGGAVGAVVGFYIGGPAGAQWGWMIGSAVGGYVDPEVVKSQGPRLQDAMQQTARDGIPITRGWGTFPTAGNIMWRAPLVENVIVNRERQGKGGNVVNETTSFQYTRSYAIGICRGPIEGFLIVKENGTIVYDARTDAELTAIGYSSAMIAQTRAGSAQWLASGVRVYYGDNTQVADPTMEAHEGVGNVTAYHGLAYITFINRDLTDFRGAIPQYEFVVVAQGTSAAGFGTAQWAGTAGTAFGRTDDATAWSEATVTLSGGDQGGSSLMWGGGVLVKYEGGGDLSYSNDRGATWNSPTDALDVGSGGSQWGRYLQGKFWIVNISGSLSYANSADGDQWAEDTTPAHGAVTTIGGNDNLILIGDNAGYFTRSTDGGGTWLGPVGAMGGAAVLDMASNGAVVVAVGESNHIVSTVDGASFDTVTSPFSSGGINRIRYSAGLGLWVCTQTGGIGYSSSGVSWSLGTLPTGMTIRGIDCNDERFVIVGEIANDTAIYTSIDGLNWTNCSEVFPTLGDGLLDVAAMPCDGTPIPGSPGFYVHDDGTICGPAGGTLARQQVVLGTIVADICKRQGLTSDQYDVSQLTDVLDGERIAYEGSGETVLAQLMAGFFFDAAEFDGVLHFIKRGGVAVAALTMDDLAEREGDALQIERSQEAELLRRTTVMHLSAASSYTPTTQTFERRAGTVEAKGEASIELPIVIDATTAAQIAEKRTKVAWSETEKYKFNLPKRFSWLTPTDVITLTDAEGIVHRMRIMKMEEEAGVLFIEAVRDRQQAYIGKVTGAGPSTPPGQTPPPVRGPTIAVAWNGPPPKITEDSKAGFWIAGTGLLSGYVGYDLSVSADGGDTWTPMGRFTNAGRIGWLTAAITSSSTTIPIQFYGDAEIDTITDEQLAANQNVWIIKTGENAEFGQSQTATPSGDGYDLTDNERGLLGVPVTSHNVNDDFVMVDQGANYIAFDTRFKGVNLLLWPVSVGTLPEDNPTISLVYDPPEIVWDGNGDDDEGDDGPDPDPGGAGTPGTPTARTIGATVSTPSLTAGEANAAANSTAINAAFAGLPGGGGIVRIPAGTYYVNTANPILLVTNSRLDLATNGAILRAAGSSTTTLPATHRDIVRVDGIHDWEITGGQFIGYRAYWKANGGVSAFGVSEWAHGVYVANSSYNGTIYNTSFDNFVGDGISLGRSAHDIHILNVKSTNNRRQGISTGADDVLIENCECSYIGVGDGTAPRAGIDIEIDGPETNTSNNTTVTGCYLHHNAGPGLICYRSCDDITVTDNRIEYNVRGIYAYDSQNVDCHDNTIRFNGLEGVSLLSTCANWDLDGNDFYGNKTRQYGTPSTGLDTTTSPTSTQKAKHITVASTVTGTTYGTNTYGPV